MKATLSLQAFQVRYADAVVSHGHGQAKDFQGPGPSLCQQMHDFMNGAAWEHLPELRQWTGALALLRCCERQTEATTN